MSNEKNKNEMNKKVGQNPQDSPYNHPDLPQTRSDAETKADDMAKVGAKKVEAEKPAPVPSVGERDLVDLKDQQLNQYRVDDTGQALTTNTGLKMAGDEQSLKAGERGPTLMEDFHFREKMTHFDHERIPERIVHARGSAAHGYFEVTHDVTHLTKAKFMNEIGKKTPVFVRFSTVQGFRGSPDMVRDVRGFATKFYTEEGNFDMVGNNIPVFAVHDAIKFPDFVHALKPEPDNEMPQAQSAHDTLWDFFANNQEMSHKLMWMLSDRAVPRSYRTIDGFGVNTFRLVNAEGKGVLIKWHWRSLLGAHSVVWDEAQKINGRNPDFHREDLWEAIEMGNYPQYDLFVQVMTDEDLEKLDFDVLDDTKLIPEEIIPLTPIGRMTLNRNVDNFFAEVEQAAFHPGHVVPGIDFSNDPMLQGRLFSYTDTQLIRLGGPNFQEIPINRSIAPVHNNQRDGYMRQTINVGKTSYHKNAINANSPAPVPASQGGYEHYQEMIDGRKVRAHSPSFDDHFTQATMFYRSQTPHEQQHIINAGAFELAKCKIPAVRENSVEVLSHIDHTLASEVAKRLGLPEPSDKNIPEGKTYFSLSQESTPKTAKTRKLLVSVTDGFKGSEMFGALEAEGITVEIMSERMGMVKDAHGNDHPVRHTIQTGDPVLYDAFMLTDTPPPALPAKGEPGFGDRMKSYMEDTYMHHKPLFLAPFWTVDLPDEKLTEPGVLVLEDGKNMSDKIVELMTQARFWDRNIDIKPQDVPNIVNPKGDANDDTAKKDKQDQPEGHIKGRSKPGDKGPVM